ncbi:MAG TPA: DMT family transporter [Hyphomicrobiaceae bacterium]|nr:DMT family transporter [Hyphomicrobiaceae bacterium]
MSIAQDASARPAGPLDRLDVRAVLVLLICCACWGVNQAAIKIANAGISPTLQGGLRSVCAGVLVLAWAQVRAVPLFERDGTLWPGLLAGLMFSVEFMVLYIGLDLTTASRGVVLLYLSPFVVAVGAHYLIPGDRLTLAKVVGLTAALAGLAVAVGESFAVPGRPTLTGDLLCLLAAVLWGATTVLIRTTALKSAAPEKTLLYQLFVSGLVLPPMSVVMGEPGIGELTPAVLAAFAYTAVIVAFITYIAWFWLVRNYPPTRVAAFTFLSPVFGVIAGNLMLGEAFTPSLAAALLLIACGIYLVNRPAR